ncbi:uncharacterized protein BXZ73DRAFT_88388 [Epithele typhae]|uniref:uncharacterized protein n=1 Tax=Epithele typhae TaxID=378194 RepID=UPI00200794FF|nr:uncharacterized protein BXZ73DRAFT_88388 [Epithele typhae]KAH9941223.1 hypothetical protein BXZ73DRAFT_88388 [Epithele typhae]
MTSPYANWPTGIKTESDAFAGMPPRRSGSRDHHSPYGTYPPAETHRGMASRTGMRPHSSSTSSLMGAMGPDAAQIVGTRTSVTPPSGMTLPSWNPSPTSSSSYMGPDDMSTYMGMSGGGHVGTFAPNAQYSDMFVSPETSPRGFEYPGSMIVSPAPTPAPRGSHSPQDKDIEINRLRQRIRELELVSGSDRLRIRELEAEVSRGVYHGGLPSPMPTPHPRLSFQEEWRARTNARAKLYCSLNRAGNALCAWHDSQALFEESLSRHKVGSYHPGENVRMDPALRNPLLKLLQERYGYQDGDFERDPVTGNWIEGEGAAYWEQQVASGAHMRRRQDSERR